MIRKLLCQKPMQALIVLWASTLAACLVTQL